MLREFLLLAFTLNIFFIYFSDFCCFLSEPEIIVVNHPHSLYIRLVIYKFRSQGDASQDTTILNCSILGSTVIFLTYPNKLCPVLCKHIPRVALGLYKCDQYCKIKYFSRSYSHKNPKLKHFSRVVKFTWHILVSSCSLIGRHDVPVRQSDRLLEI